MALLGYNGLPAYEARGVDVAKDQEKLPFKTRLLGWLASLLIRLIGGRPEHLPSERPISTA